MISKLNEPAYMCFRPLAFTKELGLSRDLLLIRWMALQLLKSVLSESG
jgi:hypothetical protein